MINPVFDANEQVAGQYQQAARWASLLIAAGYEARLHGTGEQYPFHYEWRVFSSAQGVEAQVASIDIDGCGASWHGDDRLWLKVIGHTEWR